MQHTAAPLCLLFVYVLCLFFLSPHHHAKHSFIISQHNLIHPKCGNNILLSFIKENWFIKILNMTGWQGKGNENVYSISGAKKVILKCVIKKGGRGVGDLDIYLSLSSL